MLFVIVRGFAVADPFDLLLPLWAIVLITMLVDCADTVGQDMATVLLPARSDASISVLHASALR